MLKKVLMIAVLVAVVCSFGAASAFARNDTPTSCVAHAADGTPVAVFCDGRLNALDMDQPVAIYYTREAVQVRDSSGNLQWDNAISGIQLWAVGDNGVGQLALNVPLAQITSAMASAAGDIQIAANGVYTLNYSPASKAFWVTGPNNYSFVWTAW